MKTYSTVNTEPKIMNYNIINNNLYLKLETSSLNNLKFFYSVGLFLQLEVTFWYKDYKIYTTKLANIIDENYLNLH